jgi:hypothetical protein
LRTLKSPTADRSSPFKLRMNTPMACPGLNGQMLSTSMLSTSSSAILGSWCLLVRTCLTISLVESFTDNTQSTTKLQPSDYLSLENPVVPTSTATTTTPADGTALILTTGHSPTFAQISGSFISSRARTRLTLSSNSRVERSILGVVPDSKAVQLSSTRSSHESSTRITSETKLPFSINI